MKCIKLDYASPVFGSVECFDIPNKEDREAEFGPEAALKLYERSSHVKEVFDEHTEDLVFAVPEGLKDLIVKAVFGKLDAEDYDLKLITEIYVRQEPTEEQHEQIIDWICGQLSDGWGEGVERREVHHEEFEFELYVFDEDDCEYQSSTRYADAYYHLHPWARDSSWSVKLEGRTPVDIDIPCSHPVVHSAYCMLNDNGEYTTRTVYKFNNSQDAVSFIKNSGALHDAETLRLIEEKRQHGKCCINIRSSHKYRYLFTVSLHYRSYE